MASADVFLETQCGEEDDVCVSEQDEADAMSLASDLDSDDLAEVEEQQKWLEKARRKPKRQGLWRGRGEDLPAWPIGGDQCGDPSSSSQGHLGWVLGLAP